MAPSSLVVAVIADSSDPVLPRLHAAPLPGVRFVVGDHLSAFDAVLSEIDAVLLWSSHADHVDTLKALVPRAPRLRWVHVWSAGVDRVLSREVIESPLVLTNARGVYSQSLAEFALGGILYFAKDFSRMKASQARGAWDPFDVRMLRGATLGIVGYGDIGRAVATLGRALSMELVALRRDPSKSQTDPLAPAIETSARAVCERADYLVLALPMTKETHHLIGAAEIGAMKKDAVLVNVGRGAVVDEAALVRALERGEIRGAALDVFEREPLPPGHPFFAMPNVLLSPHCADRTATWREEAMDCFLENARRFTAGEELRNVVEKRTGY